MALWLCLDCSAAYAVGQSRCPNCQSTDYIEEGVMPKITVHGGATNDAAEPDPGPASAPDDTAETSPEEESSPGSSSTTSSPKPPSSSEPTTSNRRSRARTTANPS